MKEIENRRSVRKYADKKVEREKLERILESARLAPSGNNTQPWNFIVVEAVETKARLVAADHGQRWMLTAPVFIVCVADILCRVDPAPDRYLDEESSLPELKQVIRDTAIAAAHILLEAESQGLASCWTGWFEQKDIRPVLNIPDDKYVCGVITLGYAAENPEPSPRRALAEMVRYEKWD